MQGSKAKELCMFGCFTEGQSAAGKEASRLYLSAGFERQVQVVVDRLQHAPDVRMIVPSTKECSKDKLVGALVSDD